jgi:hypothetical protein
LACFGIFNLKSGIKKSPPKFNEQGDFVNLKNPRLLFCTKMQERRSKDKRKGAGD